MANCTSATGGLISGISHKSTAAKGTSTKQIRFFVRKRRIKALECNFKCKLSDNQVATNRNYLYFCQSKRKKLCGHSLLKA